MKIFIKSLIVLFICILVFSCNSVNKNNLHESIINIEGNVEKNIQDITEEILNAENNKIEYDYLNITQYHYANGNGTIIEIKTDRNIDWVLRRHYQNIQIGRYSNRFSDRRNLNIYNQPSLESNIVRKLNEGDYINIIQIAEYANEGKYHVWLNVVVDDINGWLYCNQYDINEIQAQFLVPYYNNRWEINSIIENKDHVWTIRKMIFQHVSIWVYEEYDIRDMPGNVNSNIISTITPPVNMSPLVSFEVIEATEETEIINGKEYYIVSYAFNNLDGDYYSPFGADVTVGRVVLNSNADIITKTYR